MASNSGTGLIDGNGKRNQLYRAFNAVYQPEKHGISEIIVQKIRHNLISSVDFKHHQSANSDVFNPGSSKVRIDDAMSTIRDESRKRYDRDEHSRIPERRWLSTRNIDESRMFLRINDCSDDQSNVQPTTYNNTLGHALTNVRTESERGGLRLSALYAISRFRGRGRGSRAERENEAKL